MNRSLYLTILAGLNMADYLTTIYLLDRNYQEMNPLVLKLIELGYYDTFKIAGTYIFLSLAFFNEYYQVGDSYKWVDYVILAVALFYFFGVLNNLLWIIHYHLLRNST